MKTLCLSLKKEWFSMIDSGTKTEEYREIKPYWIKRFFVHSNGRKIHDTEAEYFCNNLYFLFRAVYAGAIQHVKYTHVKFSYGYTKRTMTFQVKSIWIGRGNPKWGAPTEDVIITELGDKIQD